ncbi:MAG: UDP-N-acetylmuramoyl-tripeptide--D-alanyl-D-alanine ligase [Clostridiales bacterium]|nr:UDP-N-acetylmuramoyl-tripeptide--D-alanyl-D-alanine ligase [Clostridiales bacterium]
MNAYIENGIYPSVIASVTGGRLIGDDREIKNITTDSRNMEPGSLFVAIRGERFDGHAFIEEAYRAGAFCVLAERIDESVIPLHGSAVLVDNTVQALGQIAKYRKDSVHPFTVGVTGSTGKTTTKEFIYSVLSASDKTHKTEGNFNNEIGLPLTMLKIKEDSRYLVLEMGMSMKGEIEYLSRLASPDLAVITNIGNSHIENFSGRQGIRDAKLEIRSGLKPGGKLILNGDEPLLAGIENGIYVAVQNQEADYYVSEIINHGSCTTFCITHNGQTVTDLTIPSIGEHNVFDASLAYAVGIEIGLDEQTIRKGLLNFKNTGMRQNIYKMRDVTVIEDCYNASPSSMSASLSVLSMIAQRENSRSIAVLGDMRELGDFSRALHEEVGEKLTSFHIDKLFSFGNDAAFIAHGAKKAGMPETDIHVFRDLEDVKNIGNALKEELKSTDVVLFKASRAVRLERVIDYVKE